MYIHTLRISVCPFASIAGVGFAPSSTTGYKKQLSCYQLCLGVLSVRRLEVTPGAGSNLNFRQLITWTTEASLQLQTERLALYRTAKSLNGPDG